MNTNTTFNITHTTFTVTVDETKTVEELVSEGGHDHHDWDGLRINSKNFPRHENGAKSEKDIVLFHFGKKMTSGRIVGEMEKEGYRPATAHELLSLGIAHPELQREFPVVALGFPSISLWGRRAAYGHCFEHNWAGCHRFAGVLKQVY